jgi:hypothetical protein
VRDRVTVSMRACARHASAVSQRAATTHDVGVTSLLCVAGDWHADKRHTTVEFGRVQPSLSILPENCRTCGARVAVPGSDTHTCHNTLNTSHDITRRAEHTGAHRAVFSETACSRLFAVTRRCGMGDVSEMSPRCLLESEPAAAARVDEMRSDASACNWRAVGGRARFGRARHQGLPGPIRAKRRAKRLGRQKDVTQESEVVMHESSYPSHSMHESSYPSHTVG